ncbi:MAG TPA: energy transducer TonB [Verrucomicrobiae bacterium]|nr:energy transducer TonB [Verrucomicrobiae bacterium]
MKRGLLIFYAAAVMLHAGVLFLFKPSVPSPPAKVIDETYVDVALSRPPEPEPPKPVAVPPPPKIETPPPKPEEKTEPPPPIKPEMTVPEPPAPPPEPKPVIVPPPPPRAKDEYVSVSEPKYADRVEPVYPEQARHRHEQGNVVLALFINESGVLDRVEVIKSSGFPLLDGAAIKAVKQSRFVPALENAVQVRSHAEVTVAFRLQ